jgi:chromatin remodeling complex protein RSC6
MVKKKTKAKRKVAKVKRKPARKVVAAKKKTAKKAGGKRKSGLTQMTYGCSEELQAIGCGKRETRPAVVKKIWNYIKAHKCQDSKNRRMINPDKKLAEVLGSRPLDMLKLAGHISKHLSK